MQNLIMPETAASLAEHKEWAIRTILPHQEPVTSHTDHYQTICHELGNYYTSGSVAVQEYPAGIELGSPPRARSLIVIRVVVESMPDQRAKLLDKLLPIYGSGIMPVATLPAELEKYRKGRMIHVEAPRMF